jgi:hypothetical protein
MEDLPYVKGSLGIVRQRCKHRKLELHKLIRKIYIWKLKHTYIIKAKSCLAEAGLSAPSKRTLLSTKKLSFFAW